MSSEKQNDFSSSFWGDSLLTCKHILVECHGRDYNLSHYKIFIDGNYSKTLLFWRTLATGVRDAQSTPTIEFRGKAMANRAYYEFARDIENPNVFLVVPQHSSRKFIDELRLESALRKCVLGLLALEFPLYVMLEIVDWLEPMSYNPSLFRYRKVRMLEGIMRSRRKIIDARRTPESRKKRD